MQMIHLLCERFSNHVLITVNVICSYILIYPSSMSPGFAWFQAEVYQNMTKHSDEERKVDEYRTWYNLISRNTESIFNNR